MVSGGGSQVIIYVEDVNDEVPVFTQRQYNRLGLRETAGIGTSVAVVRATDRDTGRKAAARNRQLGRGSGEISRCTDPGLSGLKLPCGTAPARGSGLALVVPASSRCVVQPAPWLLLLPQGMVVW